MVRLGNTVRIQILVRHDMESVELHGKVDNIGKVGEMTRLGWVILITICHLVLMSNDLPKL